MCSPLSKGEIELSKPYQKNAGGGQNDQSAEILNLLKPAVKGTCVFDPILQIYHYETVGIGV